MFSLTALPPPAPWTGLAPDAPDAPRRADAAADARQRIGDFPGAQRLPTRDLELYVVRDFLPPATCAALIAAIDAGRTPSTVVADDPIPNFRTSETCYLDARDPSARGVETQLDALTGIAAVHGELMQGQRYGVGQEFKPHHDFFDTRQRYWQDQALMGGQRTWTAMAFLNTPEDGGRTAFPEAGLTISPRAGNLLVWNNLDPYGLPNQASLHQGMPVLHGVKYVLTKWYRERPWCR